MGCSSSKEPIAVPSSNMTNNRNEAWSDPVSTVADKNVKPPSAGSRKSRKSSSKLIRINSAESSQTVVEDITADKSAMKILERQNSEKSLESLEDDSGSNRGVSSASSKASTTSKTSTYTYDSGLEVDCPGMITENSDPTEVKKIEEDARPPTPELLLAGTKIESRKKSSGKTKPQTTAAILEDLKSQGLLTASPAKAQSGMSFEVMIAPEFGVLKRPPPRLAKLKKRKKKQRELTKEEVEAKLKAAEERRKKKEAKMIERLNTSAKERQVQQALDSFVESQREQTMSKVEQDLDAAAQRREEKLRLQREKLEKKKAHAARVRLAKLERMAQTPQPDEEGSPALEEGSLPSEAQKTEMAPEEGVLV